MDEKEIQATMDRLVKAWDQSKWDHSKNVAMTLEAFKLASDTLVKFTRLVEAIECIASCQIDVAEAIEAGNTSLEMARPEGTC
jgi:transglutaminase/protease-like cytokinesis protein 3